MAFPAILLAVQIAAVQYFLSEQQAAVRFISSAQTVIEADFRAVEQAEQLRKQIKSLPSRFDSLDHNVDDIEPIFGSLATQIDIIRSSEAIRRSQSPAFDVVEDHMTTLAEQVEATRALIGDSGASLDELIEGAIFADRATQELHLALDDLAVELRKELQLAVDREREIHNRPSIVAISIGATAIAMLLVFSWAYVDRNLVARLTRLSSSMDAVAGGNLRIELPPVMGRDEITEMTHALTVFRDTAIEIEENNLRDIADARQRLIDAIESTSQGFAFYDADDRLILSNAHYEEMLYGDDAGKLEPGTPFEVVIRRAVRRGLIRDAVADPESYVQRRLEVHRNPGAPLIQERTDGRWIMIIERRVAEGGTVAVYSDVSELKQREIELELANHRTTEAAEELTKRHRELEALSSKLSKYLSPQVYASIFSGTQTVELESQRKKLTIFFSDIEGFTEITDIMESEDLTDLLNEYLTEMSLVAQEYGGTIDKYIGDGIMIFFGDPETKGVKEDAIACVTMALAMQKTARALGQGWRASGIVRPLRCRIGVHTGYCTVGNFGSRDRMDYTIIGGSVNLAARLEQTAAPGEVLISYETYALVRDCIHCEEFGEIEVRGLAHPVAIYRALELRSDGLGAPPRILKETDFLRLEVDTGAMTPEQLRSTSEILKAVSEKLSQSAESSGRGGP